MTSDGAPPIAPDPRSGDTSTSVQPKQSKRISGGLRKAIERARKRGLSRYRLWQLTGVGQPSLSAFAKDREGLSLDAADKIAEVLKLRIVEDARRRPAKKARR